MPALWVRRQLVARSVFYQSSCSASSVTKPPLQEFNIDPQFCPVVALLALMRRQEGVCSFLQPSYDEERVQCRDFPLGSSGIESSHINSSGIESLKIDSFLIDPPIRRFPLNLVLVLVLVNIDPPIRWYPLNLVGFYVWRYGGGSPSLPTNQVKRLIILVSRRVSDRPVFYQ
jgi:hypothetical protein